MKHQRTSNESTSHGRRHLVSFALFAALVVGGGIAALFAEITSPSASASTRFLPYSASQRAVLEVDPAAELKAKAQANWPRLCETYAGSLAGNSNGRISPDLLRSLAFSPNHSLRPDAAVQLELLNQAFRNHFGVNLQIVSSYRTYITQHANVVAFGELAAEPGSSNHGWGIAVDLVGGVEQFGTPEKNWMAANAPAFGWVHPYWAQENGGLPEPWHWEFHGTPHPDFENSASTLDGERLNNPNTPVEVDPAMWLGNCH